MRRRTGTSTRNIRRCVTAVALALVMFAAGDSARADTKYGLLFVGERIWTGDVRAIGLGSDYHLLEDSLALQYNPATLSCTRKFTFAISGYYSVNRATNDEYVETDASAKFTSLIVAFPIMNQVTLGLGFRGLYDATGNFVIEKEDDLGQAYGEFYNRTGGLSSFPFLAAVNLSRYLQVGGYYSFERGQYEQRWDILFADPTKKAANSTQEWKMTGRGYGFGIVMRPPGRLLLGVTYDGGVDYDAEIVETHSNTSLDKTVRETIKMPERWTFSGGWRIHRMFSIYGSYSARDFTKFEGTSFPQDRLYKEETAGVGFEYHRGLRIGRTRMPIRLGATWTGLPYDYPAGERVSGVLFELGLGLKLRTGKGKIDLAFQGGTVGDVSINGIEDRVFRVYLGITGAEVWRRHQQTDF
jgi:hypothetical protein